MNLGSFSFLSVYFVYCIWFYGEFLNETDFSIYPKYQYVSIKFSHLKKRE